MSFLARYLGLVEVLTPILSAYAGVAVLSVMLVTTVLVSLVMLIVWEKPMWLVLPFFLFYFILEGLYFSATIFKVTLSACSMSPLLFACQSAYKTSHAWPCSIPGCQTCDLVRRGQAELLHCCGVQAVMII